MNTQDSKAVLRKVKSSLEKLYGNRLKELILYGEYARNAPPRRNDIKLVAVLKDEEISIFREVEDIERATASLGQEYQCNLDIIPTTENRFDNLSQALFMNVKKEGVKL